MADDFLSVLERAMQPKQAGGSPTKTMTGRPSSDNDTATHTINPGRPLPPPEVDDEQSTVTHKGEVK